MTPDFYTSIDTSNVGGSPVPIPKVSLPAPTPRGSVRARYDAADLGDASDARHFAHAISISADWDQNPQVRRVLRNRARYEYQNNSYLQGVTNSVANDVVGVCPRLQLQSGDIDADRFVENEFSRWMDATGLPDKLRLMRKAKLIDGESFALISNNPILPHEVQLDIIILEAEQVSTPLLLVPRPGHVDGIIFDKFRQPITYHILKENPSEPYAMAQFKYDEVPASDVIHLFRCDRASQVRGVSEIAPALYLFAKLRRFTDATLGAAEAAAQFTLILETPIAPDTDVPTYPVEFDNVPITRNMFTTLPAGMKLSQMDSKHPTSTYEGFKIQLLCEIGRCLNIPRNIMTGDSSSYNYSSSRMDSRLYYKSVEIERAAIRGKILNPLLRKWLEEARLIPGYLPPIYRDPSSNFSMKWLFDQPQSIDPTKDVAAYAQAIATGQMNRTEVCAIRGVDFEEMVRQRAREEQLLKELGLNFDETPQVANSANPETPDGTPPSPDESLPDEGDEQNPTDV